MSAAGRTWVGDHPGSEMQCHVALDALKELGVDPGDEIEWRVEDGRLVGRPIQDA